MCVCCRVIFKPHFSVFPPRPLMRQKSSNETAALLGREVQVSRECDGSARKGLVRDIGLGDNRALSRNQGKALWEGSWIKQVLTGDWHSQAWRNKGSGGHWNLRWELNGEDHMAGRVACGRGIWQRGSCGNKYPGLTFLWSSAWKPLLTEPTGK